MAEYKGRYAAKLEGDFVVFLIGARINQLLLIHKWLPVARAMPRMLRELSERPELGLLHAESFLNGRTVLVLQYWRSFEHLHAYAHARDKAHLPAWAAFNRSIGNNGSVGIYHETYVVRAGEYESIYGNMPPFGLARAGETVPAIGRMGSARDRMRARAPESQQDPYPSADENALPQAPVSASGVAENATARSRAQR